MYIQSVICTFNQARGGQSPAAEFANCTGVHCGVVSNSTNVCHLVWPSLTVSLILPIIIYSSGPIHLFAFLNKVLGRIKKNEIFSEWPTFKSCSFTLKKRENYFSIFTLMTMISSKNELNYNRIDFKLITLGISVYWDELTVS